MLCLTLQDFLSVNILTLKNEGRNLSLGMIIKELADQELCLSVFGVYITVGGRVIRERQAVHKLAALICRQVNGKLAKASINI